ncbi:uncharacterized protein YjbI with pentapeptide repeats [Bradyrhizobium sp. cir1]|uniref:pentapeptide repeat-containing protein n=1 Tax=Bradyrhizobium sp. cir1 TaxID=1445730 RepID=UPI0016056A77|nr:pentapeptide repeat-containing protein [Bradyrhizobium sp. cir1]MBB4368315.1 uncharacterized protein YjbI with pentapeptide repeats [Bradyrhizobium sp. cir1]
MLTVWIVPLLFIGIFGLIVFFWFWWAAPRAQVPPYLEGDDLKRLELQDRLRQTNYQVLTGLGLAGTFFATVIQLTLTSQQWSSDHELRVRHEQDQSFAEASKDLIAASDKPLAERAAIQLRLLAIQAPADLLEQANAQFSSVARAQTRTSSLRVSRECTVNSTSSPGAQSTPAEADREEPPAGAQAAVRQLGSSVFAGLRRKRLGPACGLAGANRYLQINLEHRWLDDLDMGGLDLSCANMSQSKLHRVSLNGAKLFGADLRGSTFADWEIEASPGWTGYFEGEEYSGSHIGFSYTGPDDAERPRTGQSKRLPEWQTYRCFISDLRYADLRAVNFEGASLAGADLAYANLAGANLCAVDVSRANFTGARGLTREMVDGMCAGGGANDLKQQETPDWNAQPFGLDRLLAKDRKWVKRCGSPAKLCAGMDRATAIATALRPHW